MKKVNFTKEFYCHLFLKIKDELPDVEYREYNGYNYGFDVDGYYIDLDVYFVFEWNDESFDHAFGTWRDPNPCYIAVGVERVENVEVYISGTEEKVTGFSCEDFIKAVY